ncbi:5'-methylthioadenosine/S-adenosylhomocysteine nucleosidase [Mesorhizobium sp. CN2-181]|uniref:5'-methylthioadenosine/S-adenosylhomocysteine nucleosidase n=1 Tax=Mesorhizobium yinganensis TaxID=3157707 RepID=UPI0032B7C501
MFDYWLKVAEDHLDFCCVTEPLPLQGLSVRVRHSRSKELYCDAGMALGNVLARLGADIKSIEDIHRALTSNIARSSVESIDAFVMIAGSTGVSAEALELSHEEASNGRPFRKKLHVALPVSFAEGFIRKRLEHHGVSIDLFRPEEVADGKLCVRTVDTLVNRRRHEISMARRKAEEFAPTIGIVVALQVEYEAIVHLLNDRRGQRERDSAGTLREYEHGTLPSHDGRKHHIVVTQVGKGNNRASVLTERMLSDFKLDEVIMVGVAAGIPQLQKGQADVRLGDVVISNEMGVIQTDFNKKTSDGVEYIYQPRPPSQAWLTRSTGLLAKPEEIAKFCTRLSQVTTARALRRGKRDRLIDDPKPERGKPLRRPANPQRIKNTPIVHAGPIGSANTVLKNAADRERLRSDFKLLAVEMEASGVAEAAMQNGTGFFVVRGICDYANDAKEKSWQPYAATAAAVFAVTLIESMPTPRGRHSRDPS